MSAFRAGQAVTVGNLDHIEELAHLSNRTGIILRIVDEADDVHDWEFLPVYIVDFGPAENELVELFQQELEAA